LYANAEQKARIDIHEAIANNSYNLLESWYDRQRFKQLRFLSLREVRQMASDAHIIYVASYSKNQLLEKIREKRNRRKAPGDEKSPASDTSKS